MNTSKVLVILMVLTALVVGAGVYYTQVYAFYDKVSVEAPMQLTTLDGQTEDILTENLQAIDADSSPLRYRACFTTPQSQAMLSETYQVMTDAVPLTGPRWFDCYNAQTIGNALENGDAIAFLSQRDIHDGVDRVIAIFPDGRAFAWHQLNEKYKD